MAAQQGVKLVVYAGTSQAVAFFAYPGKPSLLIPENCLSIQLSERTEDTHAALVALADILGAPAAPAPPAVKLPADAPKGKLTPGLCAVSLARHIPENAIVVDEGVTSSAAVFALTQTARPHDWLNLTGGAIGEGLPLGVGAAVAAPNRKVVVLEGDGSWVPFRFVLSCLPVS
jgi:acetolactate synthase-1/2/3 large subunit